MILVEAGVIAGLVWLLVTWEKPFVCSGLYGAYKFLMAFAFTEHATAALVVGAFSFAVASAFFWVLNLLDEGSGTWWLTAVVGMMILYVLT